jgi:hypothetical protein
MAQSIPVGQDGAFRIAHPSDSAELRWYYRSGGLAIFQSSAFGGLLDRAATMAFGGNACERCGGCGFVPSCSREAESWRQANERERELLVLVGIDPSELLPPLADRVCGVCSGSGWVPKRHRANKREALTARPRAHGGTWGSKKGKTGGVEVGDVSLARLGAVSGRLALLSLHEQAVLEEYYSPSGGALVALYPFTAAGKTLLRRNGQKLSPRQFFENESAEQSRKPTVQRGKLLETAEQQAGEVHREAVTAWVATKRRIIQRDVERRALELLDGSA